MRKKVSFKIIRDVGSLRAVFALKGWPFSKKVTPPRDIDNIKMDKSFDGIKLNIGGGKGHEKVPGWYIVDLRETADYQVNIAEQPLPFKDDSASIVFTSHTLEHILPHHLDFVLKNIYRVLKKGGVVRILVPDIERAVKAYSNKDIQFFFDSHVGQYDENLPIGGLLASWFYSTRIFKDPNSVTGIGHVHCFDYDYLQFRLQRVGFRKIWKSSFQGSIVEELRSDAFDKHPHDSLCVEAIK